MTGFTRWLAAALVMATVIIAVVTLAFDRAGDRPKVRVVTAARSDLTSRVLAQGRVRARTQVEVASEIGGRVAVVSVNVGDVVEVGAPLFALDDEQLRNTVEQLRVAMTGSEAMRKRAQLAEQEATRALERDTRLKEKGVLADDALRLTQSRLELARADLEQSSAALERTRLDLTRARDAVRRARVTAPAAGTVVAVGVEVGQVVSAVSGISASGDAPGLSMAGGAMAPVVIADLSALIVKLEVDELDVSQVKVGQDVLISAQGIKDWQFQGQVERVGLMGREQGGAVLFAIEVGVRAVVPQAERAQPAAEPTPPAAPPAPRDMLRPGMSAQADIEVAQLKNVLTVPVAAVLEGDATTPEDRVFVIDGATAKLQAITLGATEGERIAVLSGLAEGAQVVEGPFRALRALSDGDLVVAEALPNTAPTKASGKGAGAQASKREAP